MWRCKKCGSEVEVRADIVGVHQVYLDKEGKIYDYEDWETLYLTESVITLIECTDCGAFDNYIEDIAEWVEE